MLCRLHGQDPFYPATATTIQSNAVATSNDNATVTKIQDLKAAEMSFGKALSIQREMLKSNPSNADQVVPGVASTQCNIGSIKLTFVQIEVTLITLEDAIMVQQSVLDDKHKEVLRAQKRVLNTRSSSGV
jgi:uncharacterized protein YoaH (UPF0181 family)